MSEFRSEFSGFDLADSIDGAWCRFRARLAEWVGTLAPGHVIRVGRAAEDEESVGATPYVAFQGHFDQVRCEVSTNAYLADRCRLGEDEAERIVALGWQPPTVRPGMPEGAGSSHFFLDARRSDADRLATMSVRLLQEVFAVPHPVFLFAAGPGEGPEPPVSAPESPDRLRTLVEAALTYWRGAGATRADRGLVPVPCAGWLAFVHLEEDATVRGLFAVVADGVTDRDRAAREVARMDTLDEGFELVVVGDQVRITHRPPAAPFDPDRLRGYLTAMAEQLERAGDLAIRLGDTRPTGAPSLRA